MARKPRETMRQRQMRLRRMQQAMKGSSKQLPPGKKGGSIVPSKTSSPENPRRTKARIKSATSAKGTTSKGTRVSGGSGLPKTRPALPPKGGTSAKLLKNLQAGKNLGGKGLGAVGLVLSGVATAQDLAKSLKKGEGFARLPKHIAEGLKGNKGQKPAKRVGQGSRKRKGTTSSPAKPKANTTSKKLPTTASTKTIKKSKDYQAEKKAASKAAPVTPSSSKKKTASKASPVTPSSSKKTPSQSAYAKDERNKKYDELRKAGKLKEAEALGKQIAADARKKAPKNPFRAPQGSERKDRLSKQVAELKAMGKKKKDDKPKSAANKAGWPGNRNF